MDLSCLPHLVLHLVRCCLHTFLVSLIESLVSRERSLHHVKSHPRALQVRFGWQAKSSTTTTLNAWSSLNNGCGFQVSAVVRTCTRLPGHRRGAAVSCELYRRGHSNSHLMDHDWSVLPQNKVSNPRKCLESYQGGLDCNCYVWLRQKPRNWVQKGM